MSDTETESQDIEQSVVHSLTIPSTKMIVVSFEKNKLITETPFSVNGYLDFKIWLNFEDWASGSHKKGDLLFGGWHKGNKDFGFDNILQFEQFLKGYHVDYPDMAAYPAKASKESKAAMKWLFNKKNRIINAEGIKRREFENNVNIVTRDAV